MGQSACGRNIRRVLEEIPAPVTLGFHLHSKFYQQKLAYHFCSLVPLTVHSFLFSSVTVGWLQRTSAGSAAPPQ